eukprot:2242306-Prymnesium_polylepis.1
MHNRNHFLELYRPRCPATDLMSGSPLAAGAERKLTPGVNSSQREYQEQSENSVDIVRKRHLAHAEHFWRHALAAVCHDVRSELLRNMAPRSAKSQSVVRSV